MRLHQALVQATEVNGSDTRCITRPKYAERREFVEIRDSNQTLMLHSWALPTPGTTYCPTPEDIRAYDWEIWYPEDHA